MYSKRDVLQFSSFFEDKYQIKLHDIIYPTNHLNILVDILRKYAVAMTVSHGTSKHNI